MNMRNARKAFAGVLMVSFFVFFWAWGVQGSEHAEFTHVAKSGNIFGNWTRLDHPAARGNPNAVLLVSLREGSRTPYGVYYVNDGWAIFNEDMSPIVPGTIFDVSVLQPGPSAFVIRAKAKEGAPEAEFAAPTLNESSQVRVTQLWESSGGRVYNNHPIAARWLKERWCVVNTDGADIPPEAAFNVTFVNPGSVTPSQPPATGGAARPGTPLLGVIVAAANRVGPPLVRDAQVEQLLAVDVQGYKGHVAWLGPLSAAAPNSPFGMGLRAAPPNVITVAITSSALLGEVLEKAAARGLWFTLLCREISVETVPLAVKNVLAKHQFLRNAGLFFMIEGVSLPVVPFAGLPVTNQVTIEMLFAVDLPDFTGCVAWVGPLKAVYNPSRDEQGNVRPPPANVITVGVTTSPFLGAAIKRAAEAGMPLLIQATPTTAGALPGRLLEALAPHRNLGAAGQYFVFDSVVLPTTRQ